VKHVEQRLATYANYLDILQIYLCIIVFDIDIEKQELEK
jgi:hypothetical protein